MATDKISEFGNYLIKTKNRLENESKRIEGHNETLMAKINLVENILYVYQTIMDVSHDNT